MKFPYRRVPVSKPTKAFPESSTLVPMILIRIINNSEYYDCYALIDSGAGACLFPVEYAERMGIDNIVNEREHRFSGIGGGGITAYFHNLFIEVGGYKYQTYLGFTYDSLPIPLLGQRGFFDLFAVTFNLQKESIELKKRT